MIRNRLSKWRAVAFKNLENRNFASMAKGNNLITSNRSPLFTNSYKQVEQKHVNITAAYIPKLSVNFEFLKGKTLSSLNKRFYSTDTKLPSHEIILMPALSPTMTTGNIGTFDKKVGDSVQAGDVLCEIETDKAQMDFEVQEEGFLAKILIPEGTKDAEVGKPLAIFVSKLEDVAAFANYTVDSKETKNSEKTKEVTKDSKSDATSKSSSSISFENNEVVKPDSSMKSPVDSRIKASPLAKKIAKEKGVNLEAIGVGSGPNGRIIKSDLENVNLESKVVTQVTASQSRKYIDIPLSNMRKVIANRLTESKQTIPHYYLSVQVEMDKILDLRSKFNSTPLLQETFGAFKLSVNDFIVKAAALALKKVPECNSSWQSDFIRQHESVDICVAVATPSGLITPIVSEADKRGLVSISSKVKDLAAKAKINKLKPEEYQGGTFTISNLGMYGVDSFTAIINPPQACILAVGATKLNPSSNTQVMTVTLSCDHRVVDGATGAQWLAHFKRFLEEPEQMIL